MFSLKKLVQGAENAIGGAVHNAEHAVTHAAQSVIQPAVTPSVQQAARKAVSVAANPMPAFGKYAAPEVANGLDFIGKALSHGINHVDNNYSLPVLGNVGDQVGNLFEAPATTIRHSGKLLQGQNPYSHNLPTAAGQIGMDTLNAATAGKGELLAGPAENLAGHAAAGVENRFGKQALENFIKTTTKAAPITAGYGAAGTLASGDTNIHDIAQNTALGLLTAPVLGAAHASLPAGKGIVGSPLIRNESGHTVIPGGDNVPEQVMQAYKGAGEAAHPVEQQALQHILENPKQALKAYDKRVMHEFGVSTPNVVSSDEAKFAHPMFSTENSNHLHEPASALAKVKYQQLLADPRTQDKPVLIMSGGSGAGKTSALRERLGKHLNDYAAIIDTNSNTIEGSRSRIQQALDSGRPVQVWHVHRDPVDAFKNGVIPRSVRTGRPVPIPAHLDTNLGARDVLTANAQHYSDNPGVSFHGIDNSLGKGNSKKVTLEQLPQIGYTKDELASKVKGALDEARQQGQISEASYRAHLGAENQKQPAISPENGAVDGSQPQPPSQEVVNQAREVVNQMAQDRADMLRDAHKSAGGVSRQWTPDGKLTRASLNDPFYRKYYKQYGKAPDKAAWLEEAHRQLRTERSHEALAYKDALSVAEATPKAEPVVAAKQETAPTVAEAKAPKVVDNKFTESVQKSPEVSPEVRAQVSGQHEQRSTKGLIDEVNRQIDAEGLDKAHESVLQELSVPSGQTSDATLAKAIELAKRFDATDSEASKEAAANLYDQVSEHAVGKGQGAQILSILARRSPAGLRNKAFRDLKKAGVEVTPGIQKEVQGHIDAIKKLPDGPTKDFAIAVLQKAVAKHIPQNAVDNTISIWKAGLLSGVKTQQGNAISNATFGGLHSLSDPLSTATDKVISLGTHERTKTTTLQGRFSGGLQGAKSGYGTMKTGIDPRGIGDKYEQHAEINIGNKVIQKVIGAPANFIFRGMNAADQPFFYSSLKNSLYDQAKADGINKGLKGDALKQHMNELASNPTEKMAVTANQEAAKSVLAYDTVASRIINGIHTSIIDKAPISSNEKAIAHGILHVIAPFVRVPTAFLARTVDFTPLGIGREAFIQASRGAFDQRALATAIGEGLTGTGAITLGMSLARGNQLSGDYPKNDPKEAARWKAEGITPNSIKLGGKWISLNYLGPLGLLFRAGQQMQDARNSGSNFGSQIAQATFGLGQGLMGQSFLQGFSGLSDAISDPQRSAKSFLNSQVASIVPNIANDVANLFDPMQRQTNDPKQAVEARIPGVRNSLPVKTDSLGNDLKQPSGDGTQIGPVTVHFGTLLGIKPSNIIDNPMLSEVNRLDTTGNLVFPVEDKTIGTGQDAVKLNPAQVTQRDKLVGDKLKPLWNQIMQSPEYQTLDDAHKAQKLQNALTDVNSSVNRQLLAEIDPSKLTKNATKKQAAILDGSASAKDYLNPSSKATDPKSQYDVALKNYTKNKDNMTDSGRLKAEQQLQTLSIKKDYSKDVVDFYNLSNMDKNAMFKQDPQKAQALYDQAKQLSQKLSDAGLSSKTVSTTTKTKKSTGGTKVAKSKTKGTKVAKGTKGTKAKSYDLTKLMGAGTKTASFGALRNLVKAPHFAKSVSSSVKLSKVTPKKVTIKKK